MALNALDGMMAREYNMQSKLGEVLNEIGDVVSDLFIYIPMIKIAGVSAVLVAFFSGLSVVNEFSGVMGKIVGNERQYDGPMGKSDRALIVGVLCLCLFFTPISEIYINALLALCVFLMCISCFVRIRKGLKNG